ncbi:MAG: TonB-dependent receptor [Aquisalinus sp.]|nr:TonB-dependent receptor [Aquisalinus sp.]
MAKSLLLGSASAAVLATTALSVTAYAQDGEETARDNDTIIITATRREETVQDVPINIAAVGAEQIEEQGFDELDDFLAYVPGINIVDRGGRQGNPIIVRGINADPLGSGDGNNNGGGTVATYVGEIPLFIDLKLNDLERVEVLLGPQGTLYGAGTLGGAIRYIPKKPDFDVDSLSVRAEAYQYSEADDLSTDFGFTFNKRFSDTFAIRGSLDMRDDSGFIDQPFLVQQIGVSDPDPDFTDSAAVAANLRRANDVDSEETLSGRIAARWMPNDWLDGTLTYYYQQADIGGRTINSFRSTVPAGRYESGTRVPEPNEITNELLALEVVADLGFAELTSATGFSKFEDDGQRDQTDLLITLEYSYELFPSFTSFTREVGEEERFNQEIRLVSTTDSRFNWIVGAFYNDFESVGSSSEFTPGYDTYAINTLGFSFLVDRPDDLEYFSQGITELEETAFFGEIGYDLTDRWTVTVGGRYYDYELVTFDRVDFPLFDAGFEARSLSEIQSQLPTDPFGNTGGQSDSGTLFKFNTSYDVTDDVLVYATVSEGYRIGNSNGVATCPDFDPNSPNTQGACALLPGQEFAPGGPGNVSNRDETQYGPDQTTNYELGVKSTLADGTLTLNGAVYFIEWTDPQVSSATVNANIPIIVNAEGAESKGFEVSADWRPSDQLNLRGSYSHVETELTAPVPDLVRTITPPGFGTGFEDGESGDRLPGAPEDQFSFFASYDQPLENGNDLTWNFGYAYQSDVLSRANSRGNGYVLDGFGIANASVVYDAGDWSATLFVNNLFDEYAETGVTGNELFNQTVSDFDGGDVNVRTFRINVAPPRAIGVRLNWDITGGE